MERESVFNLEVILEAFSEQLKEEGLDLRNAFCPSFARGVAFGLFCAVCTTEPLVFLLCGPGLYDSLVKDVEEQIERVLGGRVE
jgi:hypothetical protein